MVSEIVDRAQKELIIEKALKKIEETWSALQITYTAYPEMPDVFQFTVDDAIIESLEADNMALQNMGNSKYVQGNPKFQELVNAWQKKLGAVDSVLSSWNDVQRKWQALESIFVGSADIRIQLPEDAKVRPCGGTNKTLYFVLFWFLFLKAYQISNAVFFM